MKQARACGAVALGAIFHEAVEALLLELEELGHYALIMLFVAIVLFVLYKWWQRHRFMMQIRMARISIDDLSTLLKSGSVMTILDARSPERREEAGWIPGSIQVRDVHELRIDLQREIIVYCDCPNDATAAVVAKKLQALGFKRVRPLAGGLDAWRAQGLPIDQSAPKAPDVASAA